MQVVEHIVDDSKTVATHPFTKLKSMDHARVSQGLMYKCLMCRKPEMCSFISCSQIGLTVKTNL